MLKPSGGFFKRMFHPDRMNKMKKPVPGRAVGHSRPAPPKPVLTKAPATSGNGEVRTMPRGGPVNRTMPRAY